MCLFTQISIPGTSPEDSVAHVLYSPLWNPAPTYVLVSPFIPSLPTTLLLVSRTKCTAQATGTTSERLAGREKGQRRIFLQVCGFLSTGSVSSCPSPGCLYRCIIITLSRMREQAVRTENEDETGGNRYSVCHVTPWKHESKPMAAPWVTCLSGKPELL